MAPSPSRCHDRGLVVHASLLQADAWKESQELVAEVRASYRAERERAEVLPARVKGQFRKAEKMVVSPTMCTNTGKTFWRQATAGK